jgi:hypothetical protein
LREFIPAFILSTSSPFHANFSGGGIGGLAFAVALSKVPGIEVHIYEAAHAFTNVGGGIGTWSRGWEVLKKLGLAQELASLAEPTAAKEGPSEFVALFFTRNFFLDTTQKTELRNATHSPTVSAALAFRFRKSDQAEGVPLFDLNGSGMSKTSYEKKKKKKKKKKTLTVVHAPNIQRRIFWLSPCGHRPSARQQPGEELPHTFLQEGALFLLCAVLFQFSGHPPIHRWFGGPVRRPHWGRWYQVVHSGLHVERCSAWYGRGRPQMKGVHHLDPSKEAEIIRNSAHPVWSGTLAYRAMFPAGELAKNVPAHPVLSTPMCVRPRNFLWVLSV